MNKREAAIVSAYTGILIGKFDWMSKYVEELLGRPVYTHELANKEVVEQIRNAARKDFCNIEITDDDGSETFDEEYKRRNAFEFAKGKQ